MNIRECERVEVLERLIEERRWTEIDPVEFLRVFADLSEDARSWDSTRTDCSGSGCQSRESLERLATAAAGGPTRSLPPKPRLQMPNYAYLAEIGEQLHRYQQGAAALAVFEAIQSADGGDSTAVLEKRIFAQMMSRRDRFRGNATGAREVLSEPALRITAAAAARELMLAYRKLVERLKTEAAIRRHFGIREENSK